MLAKLMPSLMKLIEEGEVVLSRLRNMAKDDMAQASMESIAKQGVRKIFPQLEKAGKIEQAIADELASLGSNYAYIYLQNHEHHASIRTPNMTNREYVNSLGEEFWSDAVQVIHGRVKSGVYDILIGKAVLDSEILMKSYFLVGFDYSFSHYN